MGVQINQGQRASPWRIEKIRFEENIEFGLANLLLLLGILGFIVGLSVIFLVAIFRIPGLARFYEPSIYSTPVCLVFTFVMFWLAARKKRSGWKTVEARCLDRELKKVFSASGDMSGWVWDWRILCEYDYSGKTYRVTPLVGWSTYATEEEAGKSWKDEFRPMANALSPSIQGFRCRRNLWANAG